MKALTVEWVEKAEGDWNAANQLNRARKDPNYDGVCFHCQQSAEKYLKARLEEAGINFPKTQHLTKLLRLAATVEPQWNALHLSVAALNPYAFRYCYPGLNATKANASAALKDCKEVRRLVRTAFGLPV